ncbi:ABC transporter ATP-binding protein [Pelagicoccus sp. SDUM812003]|uniref:ABC transporter ATP-binding protein n=1 Tax=Pelagicoccus sp. SDUM812003 TaxID=3041267 RepID=UPI00280F2300|nr:ABC transporter ATP-binding protein [Pelagicoccus sp. SDUM812003]MDQ8203145.1 ABC transporter ATP-binding protein [Pelagicoccus sp. SDUM812003]
MSESKEGAGVLSLKEVRKLYSSGQSELEVLKGISFEVRQGETVSIIGPSGSGKTTLLGICAGLDQPSSGSVTLCGQSVGDLDEDARAAVRNESVGFVFQNFQLLPTLTALENVMVPLELRGERGVQQKATALLQEVGLGDRVDHYPIQLSGGEQQRVALARAFINQPQILFADEPTGNLDSDTSEPIVKLLFDLNRNAGTTLVLVTHDLELARTTDRLLRIDHGRLQEVAK